MIAAIRTFLICATISAVALVAYWQFRNDQQARAIAELTALNEEMQGRLAARQAMIERLSRTRRVAHVRVLDQRSDDAGVVVETDVLFMELDDEGSEIGRQTFTIPGDVLYIDYWTVKFDHEDVALGDPMHGRALVLLRRIYSERLAPIDGFAIDTPGAIPPGYAATDAGRYEQRLWAHFWELATDAALAQSMNVRVAQGEAVYKPVGEGEAYEVTVDAIGGMNFQPLGEAMISAAGPEPIGE